MCSLKLIFSALLCYVGEILTLVALFEVLSADSPYCYSDVNIKPISVPTSQKKKKDALAPQTFFFFSKMIP